MRTDRTGTTLPSSVVISHSPTCEAMTSQISFFTFSDAGETTCVPDAGFSFDAAADFSCSSQHAAPSVQQAAPSEQQSGVADACSWFAQQSKPFAPCL